MMVRQALGCVDPKEYEHYRSNAPKTVGLAEMARVGCLRWTMEDFEQGKGELGLDHGEATRYHDITLVLFPLAFLKPCSRVGVAGAFRPASRRSVGSWRSSSEPGQELTQVMGHRGRAHPQRLGDLPVAPALRHQGQDPRWMGPRLVSTRLGRDRTISRSASTSSARQSMAARSSPAPARPTRLRRGRRRRPNAASARSAAGPSPRPTAAGGPHAGPRRAREPRHTTVVTEGCDRPSIGSPRSWCRNERTRDR